MIWDRVTGDMGRSYSIHNSIRKGEGKGGKYLENEISFVEKKKRRKIFGEGFLWRRRKRRKLLGEEKYFLWRK